jgi:chaperonin GroEL
MAAVSKAKKSLEKEAKAISSKKEVAQIAATAAKSTLSGDLVADCLERIGKDGTVDLQESETGEISLAVTEGMAVGMGYLTKDFLPNDNQGTWQKDDVYILVYPGTMSDHLEILPLLEKIASLRKPLLIVADDIKNEALTTLLINVKRAVLDCVGVRISLPKSMSRDLLDDIAVVTGASIIKLELGMTLSSVRIEDLGRAKQVLVSSSHFSIIEGGGRIENLKGHGEYLRKCLDDAESVPERRRYSERLARVAGATATIRIGGATPQEKAERMYSLRSAVNSTTAAITSGFVLGAGLSFYNCVKEVTSLIALNDGEKAGIDAVVSALMLPIQCLARSANLEEAEMTKQMTKRTDNNLGLNVNTGAIEDLRAKGIIDPLSVLMEALEISYSYSKMFLESSSWVEKRTSNLDD